MTELKFSSQVQTGSPEWNVLPGEFFVAAGPGVLKTLLGSCVAIVLWHPGRQLGALCHYLLPKRERKIGKSRDGQYGDEALEMMAEVMSIDGLRLAECQTWCFGGASGLDTSDFFDVGVRNIEMAHHLVRTRSLNLRGHDLGGSWSRHVSLDLTTGEVSCRKQRLRDQGQNV
jgi:chemotaxis protein CheD